ncbi:hypothetical protein I79_006963 [Cricetulus griseus]|uniref:Uncharacterized protein n=1 Tax=Cricetulus griseus TaxID=10029 RepID=G3H997_CRIGR|nr:hypothetical protein I79_006963 [Cricetulus griseus]
MGLGVKEDSGKCSWEVVIQTGSDIVRRLIFKHGETESGPFPLRFLQQPYDPLPREDSNGRCLIR